MEMYMVSKFYLVRGFMDDIKSYVSSGGIHSSHLRLLGLGPALQLHRRSDHVHRVAGLCLPVRFTGVVATHSMAIGPFQVPNIGGNYQIKGLFPGKITRKYINQLAECDDSVPFSPSMGC